MAQTFTWSPYIEPTGTGSFRVRAAQFGNGYRQVAGDGINNEVQRWPLTFRGDEAHVQAILGFLRSHKGFMPFNWTPPLGQPGSYTCATWGATPHGAGLYTLTATFEQHFGAN